MIYLYTVTKNLVNIYNKNKDLSRKQSLEELKKQIEELEKSASNI